MLSSLICFLWSPLIHPLSFRHRLLVVSEMPPRLSTGQKADPCLIEKRGAGPGGAESIFQGATSTGGPFSNINSHAFELRSSPVIEMRESAHLFSASFSNSVVLWTDCRTFRRQVCPSEAAPGRARRLPRSNAGEQEQTGRETPSVGSPGGGAGVVFSPVRVSSKLVELKFVFPGKIFREKKQHTLFTSSLPHYYTRGYGALCEGAPGGTRRSLLDPGCPLLPEGMPETTGPTGRGLDDPLHVGGAKRHDAPALPRQNWRRSCHRWREGGAVGPECVWKGW